MSWVQFLPGAPLLYSRFNSKYSYGEAMSTFLGEQDMLSLNKDKIIFWVIAVVLGTVGLYLACISPLFFLGVGIGVVATVLVLIVCAFYTNS